MLLKLVRYLYVPTFISLIILYLCCFISQDEIPAIELDIEIAIDKIGHFLMYFGLSGATAFNYIYIKKGNVKSSTLFIFAIILPIIYGGFIELLQHYCFPPRSGDWFDFLADIAGSLAAFPFILWFRNSLLKKYAV